MADNVYLKVACPKCKAQIDERCRTSGGHVTDVHLDRKEAARAILGIEG